MTITPFGLIFITLGITLLVARPLWLLPLLIVSAVLHAFAVAIVGTITMPLGFANYTRSFGLGISPWLFTCSLIFIHLIAIIIRNRRIEVDISQPVKLLFWGWMIFIGWCVFSAFTLPFVFEGTPVHPLATWRGFAGPLQPLVWNRISAIQAVTVIIIGMLLVYVLQLAKNSNTIKRLMSGLIAAVLISISITFYQKFELSGMIPTSLNILHQSLNPSYHYGTGLGRTNWPFSEPSYASVWFSGVSMGGLAMYLFTSRLLPGISFIIAGLSGLLISQGGTGLAGTALAALILVIASVVIYYKKQIPLKHMLWRLTFLIVLIGLMAILYKTTREEVSMLPDIYSSIQSILQERIDGPLDWRGKSNLDALTITKDTWGLGGGLGTNRASSYLLSMISTIGVPGLALFLLLLAYQSYLIVPISTTSNSLKAFIFGGTIGMFSGMIMGIPDLLFPAWWIWLIAGFGFIASRQHFCPVQPD